MQIPKPMLMSVEGKCLHSYYVNVYELCRRDNLASVCFYEARNSWYVFTQKSPSHFRHQASHGMGFAQVSPLSARAITPRHR